MRTTIIIYIVEGLLVLGGSVVAIYKITKIVESFVSIVEVFTHFSQQDIEKIYRYSHFLAKLFKYLNKKDREQRNIAK